MPSRRAILILKGDIPANTILNLLENLTREVAAVTEPKMELLQPWKLFSLICGSGNAGPLAFLLSRLQKSIADSRIFTEWINSHLQGLERYPEISPFTVATRSKLNKRLKLLCGDAGRFRYGATTDQSQAAQVVEPITDGKGNETLKGNIEDRCDVFVWRPRESDTAPPNHLASYSVGGESAQDTMSTFEALRHTLEIRNDWCTEFPLHGLANEVMVRPEFHENRFCVILRASSTCRQECSSDLDTIQSLKENYGVNGCFDIEINGSSTDGVLKAAAENLASWRKSDDVQDENDRLACAKF